MRYMAEVYMCEYHRATHVCHRTERYSYVYTQKTTTMMGGAATTVQGPCLMKIQACYYWKIDLINVYALPLQVL